MPNPWFRFYSEWADDPKVQSMSEVMQRRLVMLFCLRCKGETLQERFATFHWRISATDLQETKVLFMEHGFIDEGWNVLNWDKRQFSSDSSTERSRRYRERLATSQQRVGDVTQRFCDALDTDTETEKKQKKGKAQAPSTFSIPDWIPEKPWNDFCEMRKKLRKPLTFRGMQLAEIALGKLRDAGNEPGAVLDQSTINCWTGLWAIKQDSNAAAARGRQANPGASVGQLDTPATENPRDVILEEARSRLKKGLPLSRIEQSVIDSEGKHEKWMATHGPQTIAIDKPKGK